jgi:hypothetical protein
MSQVTYDLLAVWAILSVPAMIVLAFTLRMQSKELARLRKKVTYVTQTRQQLTPPAADDPTSEQPALALSDIQSDLDDTHRFRALSASDHLRNEDQPDAGSPSAVRYEPNTISVFEKLRSRR